jgi:formylglycine-generating enzyme required for sulfatase activity
MRLRDRCLKAAASAKVARSKAARAGKSRLVRSIERQMVDVHAGAFQMGDLSGVNQYDHRPAFTTVSVKAFRLSRYEVTYDQYNQYADATGHERARLFGGPGHIPQFDDEFSQDHGSRPVVNVSLAAAQGFIAWLNEGIGHRFRLPTEAEWEYAARAGSTTTYPWGEAFDTHRANGDGIGAGDRWYFTAPVGSFPPNAWGLYDMIGNVWEWTQDCYVERHGDAPADGSARKGPADCRRVTRGGGAGWPSYYLYSSSRFESSMSNGGDSGNGFRLAEDR